jgi:hypothetical protein|nr:MAG TPA: hypothetical protein [Caudoviricetes sp.]
MEAMQTAGIVPTMDYSRNGYGDSEWFWIVILLFAFWGNGFNRNNGLETDIDTRFLERDVFNTNQNVSTTGCQTQRDVLETKYDLGTQVLENRFNCSQNACETQKEVLQNRYDNALQTQTLSSQIAQCCCDLRAESLANTQKVIDLIQQDKIDQLRDQVFTTNQALNNTNLANQIVNSIIPRPAPAYPSCSPFVPSTYGYNGCGCGNTTII